ncbi:MAG: hypothetical protein MJ161_06145 [Clostridia bacterium]|nr:hypothetical protein [Clostridia bacterium]
MKTLRLALMGFGNVGQAFGKMLLEKTGEIQEQYGTDVKITALATATRGNLYNPGGIDIARAVEDASERGRFSGSDITELSGMELLESAEYDCLMELSPLDIFSGQPATDHIKTAIGRGKHAITANKGPVAWCFSELRDMAEQKNVGFYYETVVMDGTPVFNLVEHTLKMTKVNEIKGILNSTTNFILEEMEKGFDMDDIMARGRQMGFIEADPAMDIEGYDAAGKVTALLNVLMDAGITPDQVRRKGIEDITIEDIRAAASRGNVIKLLCRGSIDENGSVIAEVGPEEIPRTDMLASVNSTTSIVSITTDLMKTVSVVEHEPEIEQTAYGVFGDMLRVIER